MKPYMEQIAGLTIPAHIAIIMDGNGRWAEQRNLDRIHGHFEGRKATRRIVEACQDFGVQALSLYAFSTENWTRPAAEVSGLMQLIASSLREELDELTANEIVFQASGRLEQLPPELQKELREVREITADNDGLVLNLCVNYGGRAEIVDATRAIARAVLNGEMDADLISEQDVRDNLYAAHLPDVDLLIRPGGEKRLSNFLLWETAYAELVLMDVLWPDFQVEHLIEAITTFNARQRRFGSVIKEEQ